MAIAPLSNLKFNSITKTTTTAEDVVSAPGAGKSIRVWGVHIANKGTETPEVNINVSLNGTFTSFFSTQIGANTADAFVFPAPIVADQNTAIQATLSVASTNGVIVSVYYDIL